MAWPAPEPLDTLAPPESVDVEPVDDEPVEDELVVDVVVDVEDGDFSACAAAATASVPATLAATSPPVIIPRRRSPCSLTRMPERCPAALRAG